MHTSPVGRLRVLWTAPRRIDLGRTEQLLRSADSDLSATLAACSGLIAMRCETFTSSAAARAFPCGRRCSCC
ncbi:hypothetical protein [Nannocystis sp.]|uniref:hypothetical protein n=1 Tax=Nannocystis sp. TaxID=1962667 RepID=UPI002420AD87|nr:hypothetical protein [Nannocystis sp.]MBK7827544.1 hypothetical protein [Nannocystis sp.]MBK9756423.1 hypothetical protein [Nannocystis sp.]